MYFSVNEPFLAIHGLLLQAQVRAIVHTRSLRDFFQVRDCGGRRQEIQQASPEIFFSVSLIEGPRSVVLPILAWLICITHMQVMIIARDCGEPVNVSKAPEWRYLSATAGKLYPRS